MAEAGKSIQAAAIELADAHLGKADLPSYSELAKMVAEWRSLICACNRAGMCWPREHFDRLFTALGEAASVTFLTAQHIATGALKGGKTAAQEAAMTDALAAGLGWAVTHIPSSEVHQPACLGPEWTVPAPDPVLADASFCIAVTGEAAIARVVHGGWLQLLTAFAAELWTDGNPENGPEDWAGWLKRLQDMDEWSTDEMRNPFSFTSELGETAQVSIYRLSAEVPHG